MSKEQWQYKREKIIFSTNWTSEKILMSLDTELTHMKNIKSKETTALIVNGKTLKLEDNVGGNLDDLGNKDDCLDTTLKT